MKFTNVDPVELVKILWPKVYLYNRQNEILRSFWQNDETVVVAGNMLGKDYVAGLAALCFFLSRTPCRTITTSVDMGQLDKVLWGEIRSFIGSAAYALPLQVQYMDIKKYINNGTTLCPKSYLIGKVAAKAESFLGHHLPRGPNGEPRTAIFFDEASGVVDDFKTKTDTWAHRTFEIGNPYDCSNFFYRAVEGDPETGDPGGDIPIENSVYFHRRVITIAAKDSPNVRFAMAEIAAGRDPSKKPLIPGLLDYFEYLKRRKLWDPIRQSISLDAKFYKGVQNLLYQPRWLDLSEERAAQLEMLGIRRRGKALGLDVGGGGDNTAWAITDDLGLVELRSEKTPNTAVIPKITLHLMRKHQIPAENVLLDIGGGGQQIADQLRDEGHDVRTFAFGRPAQNDVKLGRFVSPQERDSINELKYVYMDGRAELYGMLREKLQPELQANGSYLSRFAIPARFSAIRKQLAPIPLLLDKEGRLYLPKKRRKVGDTGKQKTLTELIGHSPDEADALVLSNYALETSSRVRMACGAI